MLKNEQILPGLVKTKILFHAVFQKEISRKTTVKNTVAKTTKKQDL